MNYKQYSPSGFSMLPPIVKNLLIINFLFYLASIAFQNFFQMDLSNYLGLYYFQSELFYPHQLITYMFMHADFTHILFNMFALWMFGGAIENFWGGKRFLVYYLITGIGAGLVQEAVYAVRIHQIMAQLSPEMIAEVKANGLALWQQGMNYKSAMGNLNAMLNVCTVGASGSVFGLLLAFGLTFPNTLIYIYFMIPIRAKWFVIIYGMIELWGGISNKSGDNVAHFAHLGGMLFGIILLLWWRKRGDFPYQYGHKPNIFTRMRERLRNKNHLKYHVNQSFRPKTDEEYNAERTARNKQVDAILDKIAQSGYGSLSKEEKDFLFDASNKTNW